jgi:hypothetical protein
MQNTENSPSVRLSRAPPTRAVEIQNNAIKLNRMSRVIMQSIQQTRDFRCIKKDNQNRSLIVPDL